jgi:glycosyltransferase involved in cell wall biosynthesis
MDDRGVLSMHLKYKHSKPIKANPNQSKPIQTNPIQTNQSQRINNIPLSHSKQGVQPRPSMMLSINRFERKKNIGLAIEAFALLHKPSSALTPAQLSQTQLVIAGGYDERVHENKEHYQELKEMASRNGLSTSDYPDFGGQVCL